MYEYAILVSRYTWDSIVYGGRGIVGSVSREISEIGVYLGLHGESL